MVYLLLCYHKDKLGKHLISCPIFLSYSPQQLYFSHLFSPLTFIIFYPLSPPFRLSALPLVRVCVCVCVLCVQTLEKLAHPTISPSGVHFPSVGMSEMNISGWNGAERCILTQTFFFSSPSSLSLPPLFLHGLWAPTLLWRGGGHSRSLVTSIISEDKFLTLSASVPFWHQGLPLKLFIAHHVAYIRLRCSCVEIL